MRRVPLAAAHPAARRPRGNASVFGGSYGWSSAGRFHHAQSQVHRFLNALGGYVRHVDSYSLGAGRVLLPRVLLPHVVCPMEYLLANAHDWGTVAAHTRLFVSFGVLEWIPIRPGTDTAVMLALACETVRAGRHDKAFLATHCVGCERWAEYLLGRDDGIFKDADWAAPTAGVPAEQLRALAVEMAGTRSLVNVAWALQRADHGEQPFWAAIGLASVLGQVGLPGGGFSLAHGPANTMGSRHRLLPGPLLPQGTNGVEAFIPVARVTDMLMSPGGSFDYNGVRRAYPDIRLVYWAGGNPFHHHHQDLHRLARAWRRPETIVVHEQVWNAHAKMADIVLPATSTLERDDIGHGTRDALMIAMRRIAEPPGEARDDYTIFADLAARLGAGDAFTEGRDARDWLAHLYGEAAVRWAKAGVELPEFETFWAAGGSLRAPNRSSASPRSAPTRWRMPWARRAGASSCFPSASLPSAARTVPATPSGSKLPNGSARCSPRVIRYTCCPTSRTPSCTASSTIPPTASRTRSPSASRCACIRSMRPNAASPTVRWSGSSTSAAHAWPARASTRACGAASWCSPPAHGPAKRDA